MKTKFHHGIIVFLLFAMFGSQLSTAFAQGTAFTYQGRLNVSGLPASGSYDLQFTLYITNTTGSAIAGPVTNNAVAVTNGLFTTLVDFGPGAFTGTSNWLALAVSTNAANSFSTLTPRQQVMPTPYALLSANATTAASANAVAAANVTGTLGLAQLPAVVVTNSATGVNLSGTFAGNGGGLTNIAGWHLGGNTGTTNGNYLGTTDNQPLEIRVGGVRAGLISPSNGSPNIVFGTAQNVISNTTAGASILGGGNNNIGTNSSYSVIGGGQQNSISNNADHSVLGGGINNTIQATAYLGFIGGGNGNIISSSAHWDVIGGGYQNNVQENYDFLGGGSGNKIMSGSQEAALVGGIDNTVGSSSAGAFIGGGGINSILNNDADAVIAGGYDNTVNSSYSFIGAGQQNNISGVTTANSVLVGGQQNTIQGSANLAFLGGGQQNIIQGQAYDAVLVGGYGNSISNNAFYSFLGGGQGNFVGGYWATVDGGYLNRATNSYATVAGGSNNVAGGLYSFAAGSGAQAIHSGAFVWADAEGTSFASTNANSFNVRANGGVRLVTGGTGLTVDGSPVLAGNNGGGLTNLNASQLTSGTVPLAQLPSSLTQLPAIVVTNNEPTVFLGNLGLTGNLLMSGNLTLPSPAAILSAGTPLLSADRNGNSYFGLEAGNGAGTNNTAVGLDALEFNTLDNNLVAIGYQALQNDNAVFSGANPSTGGNTAIGFQSLQQDTFGADNTAVGYQAMNLNLEGAENTAIGEEALFACTNGNANVAVGFDSLAVLGVVVFLDAPAGGNANTAIGTYALSQMFYGSGNIAIGAAAGYNNYSGDDNIYIGNPGQNGDSGIIRIGTQGTQTATYLTGTVYANGVALTSDRHAKENFKPVDNQALLAKVAALPVMKWNYKTDKADVQHIGPMAQDFQAAFGLDGTDDKHISVVDEGGVALAAIQGLNQKVEEKDAKIQEQSAEIEDLQARLKKLEQLMVEKLGGAK